MAATIMRNRGGRPAGPKRTVGVKLQLTPEESIMIDRASALDGLGPAVFARLAAIERARRVLAETAE